MIDAAAYCLTKRGAIETYPFGPEVAVMKVGGKMFALVPPDGTSVSLKCEPVRAQILRQDYPEITAGYHLNKQHWNTMDLTGGLSEELVKELVDHSYALVVGSLPVRERAELDL